MDNVFSPPVSPVSAKPAFQRGLSGTPPTPSAADKGEKAFLRWVRYRQSLNPRPGVGLAETLQDLWPASRMQIFLGQLLGVTVEEEEQASSEDEGSNARALIAYIKSERLQLALHSDDFVNSLSKRPLITGPVELEFLWHLVELSELRGRGLSVGGGNIELTLKDLIARLAEQGVSAKRFRPSNLLPITVEIVKRLSNWEPDGSEQNQHIVLAICNLILPFQLLDLEDLSVRSQDLRVFVLFLSLFLDPLAASKRIEMSKIDLFGYGGVNGGSASGLNDSGALGSPPRLRKNNSASVISSPQQQGASPFQVKKSVSSSNISSQVASQLRKKLDEKQAELEQLSVLHAKKLEILKEENAKLYQQVADSETELAEQTEEFFEMRRHRDELEEELDRALAAGMANRDKKDEVERQLVQLEAALKTRESEWAVERRALETVMQEAVEKLRQSQAATAAAVAAANEAKLGQLQARVREMELETSRAEQEKSRLIKQVARQRAQHDQSETTAVVADDMVALRIGKLEEEIDAADEENERLCQTVDELRHLLQKATEAAAASAEMQKQMEQMQKERNQLAQFLGEQQQLALVSVEEARREGEHAIGKLKSELENRARDWQTEREALRRKAEEATSSVRKMQLEMEASKTTRLDQKKKIDLLMKRQEMFDKRMAALQEEEAKWAAEKQELEARAARLSAHIEALENEVTEMHERAATHLASLRRGQAELEEEVHEAERAHQRERDLWQRSRAALVADVDRLKRLEGEKSNGALAAQELEELRRQMEALQDEHRKHVAEMEASHSKVIEELEAVLKKRQAEHDAALLLERERLLEASAQKEALEAKVVVMTENLAAKEVEAVSNVTQELVVARKQLVDAIALKEALEVELSVKSQRLLEAEARVERVGGELRSRIAELEAAENSGVAELRKKLAESEESARLADSTLAESNKLVAALRKELAELELKEKEALEELRARGERARLLFEEELRELEASKAAMVEELRVKLTQCDQTNKAMVELLREAEADGKREVEDLRAKLARSEETSKDLQDKLQRGEASAKQEVEELKVKLSQCEQTRKTLSEMLSRDSAVVVGSSPPVDDETSLKLKELSQSHEMELEKMAAALEAKMKRLEARAPRAPIPDNSNNVAVASAQEETENARQLADFEARLSETTLALRRANDALEQRALELGRVREELEGERIRAVSAVKSKYNAKIRRLVSSERERAANRIEEVEGKARVVPRASGLGTFVWWMLLVLCLMRVFIAPMFEV